MLALGRKRQKPCPVLGFQNAEQGLKESRNTVDFTTAAWRPGQRQPERQQLAQRSERPSLRP